MNLGREQRLDKNGVLNTKLVRATPKTSTGKALPAPALSGTGTGRKRKPGKVRFDPRVWDREWYDVDATRELLEEARKYLQYRSFRFEASDADVYALFSVVDPRNIIPLMALTIRTPGDARKFLTATGLGHLIINDPDYEHLAAEALTRNIPADPTIRMIGFTPDWRDMPHFLDGLEANGVKTLREVRDFESLPVLVATGQISLDDVRTVGATNVKAGAKYLLEHLREINAGETELTAAELRQVIDRFALNRIDRSANGMIKLAKRHGTALVLELSPANATLGNLSDEKMLDAGASPKDLPDIYRWSDRLRTLLPKYSDWKSAEVMTKLYLAGVSPEEAATGFGSGMQIEQVIAVHEGISPAVSDGWL